MIGKLIIHGENRELALRRMNIALSEIIIDGIETNIPLQQRLISHSRVCCGRYRYSLLGKRAVLEIEPDGRLPQRVFEAGPCCGRYSVCESVGGA